MNFIQVIQRRGKLLWYVEGSMVHVIGYTRQMIRHGIAQKPFLNPLARLAGHFPELHIAAIWLVITFYIRFAPNLVSRLN